jgi:membrane-bound lytic murein transglycosylase F
MKSLIYISFALLLSGCVPLSENTLKRNVVAEKSSTEEASALGNVGPVKAPVLDAATRQIVRSYGPTIKMYSKKYGFDWRFALAIMKAESNFSDTAESHRGASGLMQIMPATQLELAERLEIENILEPQSNIRAGIFYLSRLQKIFMDAEENDRLRLTLAAYNAGPGRVLDAREVARYLNDDPDRWQAVKSTLPLLSKQYYTLHQKVWKGNVPRSGSFSNHRETITYVEKTMRFYDEYRLLLN